MNQTTIKIFHNPSCSKSRQALQLLREREIEPQIVEYIRTPPDAATLSDLLDLLGLEPRELMRQQEKEYKQAGLGDSSLSRDQLIAAMVQHPRIIQRPIVVSGNKAAIGRPPEQILEIL